MSTQDDNMKQAPRISICIPAYNRPAELVELLDSIAQQKIAPYEVVICEDDSPEKLQIREAIEAYIPSSKLNIRYSENEINLGYDKNLRRTVDLALGDYVFLCGNDDLLTEDSLEIVSEKIVKYQPKILIRSYKSFHEKFEAKKNPHRYVVDDTLVNFSGDEMAWLFYRSVLVSGLVFDRALAHKYSTDLVDGTLYYQNYLIGRIFSEGSALYVPDYLVYNRLLDAGEFGASEIEQEGMWTPGERTPESSLYQMGMFFKCADTLESFLDQKFTPKLKKIASAYSFSILQYHSHARLSEFYSYVRSLQNMGYGGMYFYGYSIVLMLIGKKNALVLVNFLKRLLGRTVRLVK